MYYPKSVSFSDKPDSFAATDGTGSSSGGRGRADKNVPQTDQGPTVLFIQRYPCVRQHSDQQEEVQ